MSDLIGQVAEGRGPAQLVPELLIGFDPVPQLLGLLEERYGHLAAFCVDLIGGVSVGVRWKAAAFLPAPVKVRRDCLFCCLIVLLGNTTVSQSRVPFWVVSRVLAPLTRNSPHLLPVGAYSSYGAAFGTDVPFLSAVKGEEWRRRHHMCAQHHPGPGRD